MEEILNEREHELLLRADLNYFRQTIMRRTVNFGHDATY